MTDRFSLKTYAFFILALLAVMLLCVCIGSVSVAPKDTLTAVFCTLLGKEVPAGISKNIILNVRLPRVLNVALVGAALSLCGAAMQGLLRNPLADGSTLGVSSGASLGAVIALALGVTVPGSEYGGTMLMAMAFAFLSLVLILSLAYALDHSLATNSIILIGVIFSMFISSVINLILSFLNDQVRSITFWTMGSLSGGELQRTFLAQVFAQNPQILILDEPANHLDLIYQKHIFSLIETWLRQPGRAVVSVVHDLSLARKYGTHAVLMHRGQCAAQGKIGDVMTAEKLQAVYEMDVYGWMREMLGQWA